MRSSIDRRLIDHVDRFIFKSLREPEVVYWNQVLDSIPSLMPHPVMMGRCWIRNVVHLFIMGVLLNMEIVIVIDMVIRVVQKTIRV